ncbi:MAG TPA: glycosyltransferase family 2 protein [Chthoniobacterales bacterium]|nr:glycosyltransferase family 2 protein [Chthoniobacterales bacterium]
MHLPLSIALISYNEERNLARCLNSVADLAAEIVIVDSGSTDATLRIAESFGAIIKHQQWLGYRDQKNVALDLCTHAWVLALDCDEALSPELKQSILQFFQQGVSERYDGACFNRRTWFLGRWIMHGDWYPDTKLRLFRREKARWTHPIHELIILDGPATKLFGDLLHYSFPSINAYIDKINPFADEFLKKQQQKGKKWSLASTISRPLWRFFRAYILRRGFFDGFPGLWIAVATAFTVFVRYSRRFRNE